MSKAILEAAFPKLNNRYCITSPETSRYNCIAWAAGRDDRWWWPDPPPYSYWPEEPRELSLSAFIRVFGNFGYEICDTTSLENGFEKVAIYIKDDLPTHMARQLESGDWTSKCGDFEDIRHTLDGLEHSDYGVVTVIMKRERFASAPSQT